MYAGHFAAALVVKARVPRAPMWSLLVGVSLIDLIFCGLVLVGVERLTVTPGVAPGFRLDDIRWSHSLVASLVWSALYGAAFVRRGRAVVLATGAAALSHFPLDLIMHPGDLTLWPGSAARLGFGLWASLPVGWWFVELGVVAAGCAIYYLASRREPGVSAARVAAVCAAVVVLHLSNSPWLSPVR